MIKNIVLDMGGVIFKLDSAKAEALFREMGFKSAEDYMGIYGQKGIFMELEKGMISSEEFLVRFAKLIGKDSVPYDKSLGAWLGYLGEIPVKRLEFLDNLRERYNLYLLTNTNPFIWEYVDSPAFSEAGRPISDYFDKVFCSYKIHCYKPDAEMFEYLLKDTGIDPGQTVFVDDGPDNIATAASLGFRTLLAPEEGWEDLLLNCLSRENAQDTANRLAPVYREDELKHIPAKGPCLICSNHPHGDSDCILMEELVGKIRSDVKCVTEFSDSDLSEVRTNALVLFPSRENAASLGKFVRNGNIPLIPSFIEENKSGVQEKIQVRFASPVHPSETDRCHSDEELWNYLQNRIFALEGLVHKDNNPVIPKQCSPIEAHVEPSVLAAELNGLKSDIFFKEGSYSCYLSPSEHIPNILREIGVCREETFRLNGEGTGKSIDLDEYDKYFLHLHLWNDENGELVGAYRVGIGSEILKSRGLRGFYSDLFFHFKDSIAPTLEESLELGRSFIVSKYQVVPNALKMLLNNGIGHLADRYPEVRHFFGTASFSSDIPLLYSSIMTEYFKRTRFDVSLSSKLVPDIPFAADFMKINPDTLGLESLSVEQLDKLIRRLSGGKYRVPTLVRAYVKHNCRFLGFNVDPDFNYSLDGLVISDLNFYE